VFRLSERFAYSVIAQQPFEPFSCSASFSSSYFRPHSKNMNQKNKIPFKKPFFML